MRRALTAIPLLALLALLYAMPRIAAGEPYVLHVLVLCFVYAIPAVGLNLMLGYTGLVSLGHMAFAGIGAYAAAVMMVDAKIGFWVALVAATLASGAAGAAIGVVCLRFRSHFFMIVTLALGLVLYSVMNNWDDVTRGAAGFAGVPRPAPIGLAGRSFSFGPLASFYYLALTAAGLVFARTSAWRALAGSMRSPTRRRCSRWARRSPDSAACCRCRSCALPRRRVSAWPRASTAC